MTRDELATELDAIFPPLSASQMALILLLADEYAAGLVDDCARTPRSQGGAWKGAA